MAERHFIKLSQAMHLAFAGLMAQDTFLLTVSQIWASETMSREGQDDYTDKRGPNYVISQLKVQSEIICDVFQFLWQQKTLCKIYLQN